MPSELSNPLPRPARLPTKRGRGAPSHAPTKSDRDMITVMVAGGIKQADIARAKGIDLKTLRKHYREELDNGASSINTMVVGEHIKLIEKGDGPMIRWWEQARMGRRGDAEDPSKAADPSMRIVVELVGENPPPPIDHAPLRQDERGGRDAVRKYEQLVG
jgi:hypothetical protein